MSTPSTEQAKKEESTAPRVYDPATAVTATETDVGRVRNLNQDDSGEFLDPDSGRRLLMVADGMGGHRGGEVASRMAVEGAAEVFGRLSNADPRQLLTAALQDANRNIYDRASQDANLVGMGTTAVALLLTGSEEIWIAHVGDSRAYVMRDGVLRQLTADHSVVGELVRQGQLSPEEARSHPQSNEILRALGTRPEVEVELTQDSAQPGDRFLLCSDGLSGMLSDSRIATSLAEGTARQITQELVQLANEAGGMDNVTVQVVILPNSEFEADSTVTALDIEGAAAAGPWLRWAITLVLLASVLVLLLLGGVAPGD